MLIDQVNQEKAILEELEKLKMSLQFQKSELSQREQIINKQF